MNKLDFGEHAGVALELGRIVHSPDWTWMRIDFTHFGIKFYATLGHSTGVNTHKDDHQKLRKFTTQVIDALQSGDAAKNMDKFTVTPTFHDFCPMSVGVSPKGRV